MTQASAIQSDADTDSDINQDSRPPSARELELERIAEQIELSIAAESDADNPPDNIPEEKAEQKEEKPPAARMVKVKVDGVESEIPEDDLIRGYQKDASASKRLEEAARIKQELIEREAAISVREAQLLQQQNQDSSVSPPDEDVAQEFLNAMYEGDEGKTKAALMKVVNGRQQPTQDINQLTQTVAKQVKAQLEDEAATDKFYAEFKDIVADPHLFKIANDLVIEEQKSGKPYAESLMEGGKRAREWIGSKIPNKPAPRAERITKAKESMDNIPSTNATAMGSDDAPDESSSSIIVQMRKARGLPV